MTFFLLIVLAVLPTCFLFSWLASLCLVVSRSPCVSVLLLLLSYFFCYVSISQINGSALVLSSLPLKFEFGSFILHTTWEEASKWCFQSTTYMRHTTFIWQFMNCPDIKRRYVRWLKCILMWERRADLPGSADVWMMSRNPTLGGAALISKAC